MDKRRFKHPWRHNAFHVVQGDDSDAIAALKERGYTEVYNPPADLAAMGLSAGQVDALTAAGYDTPQRAVDAADADLLAVEGVGEATVAGIRSHAPA